MSSRSVASKCAVASKCGTCLMAGAIGGGLALLFAPHAGQQTRRLIWRKAGEYTQDAGDRVAAKTQELYAWGKHAAARRLRRTLHTAA